jgi:hypothetical protein
MSWPKLLKTFINKKTNSKIFEISFDFIRNYLV